MIYFFIFLFLAFISLLNEVKQPKFIYVLTALILINFAGLRGDIEGDYNAYLEIFKDSNIFSSADVLVEPGYYYLNRFFYNIGLPFEALIYVMAVLSVYPKILFFKKYSLNFGLSIFIYYCTIYFIFDFIQIRQAVAMSIFMLSLKFAHEKRIWPYFLCILVAIQFHISALIALPVYFLLNLKPPKYILYSILGICSVINIFHITIPLVGSLLNILSLPEFVASKAEFYFSSEEFSMVSLKQLALGFLFIYINKKRNVNNEELCETEGEFQNIFTNLFLLGIILCSLFNGMSELAYRIKWYFFWTESFLIVYLVRYFTKADLLKSYLVYFLLFVLYGISLFQMLDEFATRGNYIFPYKTFF
jgi:hypothetical protein